MASYYVAFDRHVHDEFVPTVENTILEANSLEDVVNKLKEQNEGCTIKVRTAYRTDQSANKQTSRKQLVIKGVFIVFGIFMFAMSLLANS